MVGRIGGLNCRDISHCNVLEIIAIARRLVAFVLVRRDVIEAY